MFLEKKNDLSFHESILRELQESRPIPPPAPSPECQSEDMNFAKYLVDLMKDLPRKRKVALQSEFIARVVEYIE